MAEQIDNEEAARQWVREQFQRASKHLAQEGILFESIIMEESRYMVGQVAIWKIKDTKQTLYWVISGDLPSDAVVASVAKTAQDAIKHFTLSWQLKAENILNHPSSDASQKEYANLLMQKAELLYEAQDKGKW